MDMEGSILNLNSFRETKQLQGEKNAVQLYTLAGDYTERTANIREKVRAKHLFRKTLGLSPEAAFTALQNGVFQNWFLFDYKTIQGSTMFSLFLKNNSRQLSEPDLIQGALFLTSAMEPIRVKKFDRNVITAVGAEHESSFQMRHMDGDLPDMSAGEWFFIRKIPIQMFDIAMGPILPIKDKVTVDRMLEAYSEAKLKFPELTWRAFLKTNVLYFLFRE
ncbi:hypothetical protein J7I93_23845 [Bacillus sp. ISL-47]|uniref:hypothetical protein n=1 Tax=Bacillus sp. ISL-47 TaxID=2819130 RepID=UPI001BE5D7D4|nr:hypothetical protein [Bacillus sp. ISL-47]MBT2691171.1 hypothetical protein [Bacillus sp. ISL-47]MBT2710327.1 hypothetical protein [Pseudomonas sp. ISL-84]